LAQPWISRRVRPPEHAPAHGSIGVWALVFLAGVYGGYFGAAQGVLLIAILGLGLAESMQRVNAAKNILALLVNFVAAVVFIAVTDVAWLAAAVIAAGSIVGGQLGATVGRRLPSPVFRGIVAVVGLVAIAKLVFFD
ncbi:MAG: sulfite exporter TauE/SafE family protein, partial [Nocardioidaceae bacterium]